jgi:hypothetical protein
MCYGGNEEILLRRRILLVPFPHQKTSGFFKPEGGRYDPFREIRNVPPMKAICARVNASPWDVDTAFFRRPSGWSGCSRKKVLDWLRENRYEIAGEPRDAFLMAPKEMQAR